MGSEIIALPIVAILFVGFPWVLFHYITKWKTAKTLTSEDENLLDELHELARRLDDRMVTIERIVQAENPHWRTLGGDPVETALEDRSERIYEATGRTNNPARRI
jgi:phage shock protein B